MDYQKFETLINRIFDYFRLNRPEAGFIKIWHEETVKIPNPMSNDIYDYFKKLDNLPRNIPKTFHHVWSEYKRSHPNKIITERYPCDVCNGEGYIFAKSENKNEFGYKHTVVFRCGHCENWKRYLAHSVPISKTEEIKSMGYNIL